MYVLISKHSEPLSPQITGFGRSLKSLSEGFKRSVS